MLFGYQSLFNGVMVFNQWTYTLYNLVFASFPIGFYCIFDREAYDLDLLVKHSDRSYGA